MKAGILAAGRGRRLAQGGVAVPKPLVRVGGQTLVGRALDGAAAAGAERAAIITKPARFTNSSSLLLHSKALL